MESNEALPPIELARNDSDLKQNSQAKKSFARHHNFASSLYASLEGDAVKSKEPPV
jgi:hypothetical protein